MVHQRQVADEVQRDLNSVKTWRWVRFCRGDLLLVLLIPFADEATPPPSDTGKAKEMPRSNSTERREDVWQDRINSNLPHRDLRFNQANLPPAGLGHMLNASMRRRPPVPPDTEDEEEEEEENDDPPISSSRVKLPMNYQKAEDEETNELDDDDNVRIP